MTTRRGARRRPGWSGWLHRLLLILRRLVEAFRHVATDGRSTETRARARATAPPRLCPGCGQPVAHSDDWRDHLHDDEDQADEADDEGQADEADLATH